MTSRVLTAWSDLHAPVPVRAALLGPLLAVLLVVAPLELLAYGWRLLIEHDVLRRAVGHCDGDPSHEVVLFGTWSCPSCGLSRQGHAFARCRCGARVAAVSCPCQMPCLNPLFDPEEDA